MLIWLIIIHFWSDFVFQTRDMGKNKSSNLWYLLGHMGIVFTCFFSVLAFTHGQNTVILFCGLNTIAHGIQDVLIWRFYKLSVIWRKYRIEEFKYWEDSTFYTMIGLDQALHTIVIITLWRYLS